MFEIAARNTFSLPSVGEEFQMNAFDKSENSLDSVELDFDGIELSDAQLEAIAGGKTAKPPVAGCKQLATMKDGSTVWSCPAN